MSFEQLIFSNIINNPEYARKVSPFLRSEYFSNREDRVVFEIIDTYINKYQAYPSKEAVAIELTNRSDLNEPEFDAAKDVVEGISETKDNTTQLEWLLENTEKFCQDKAIYNAITKAIQIMDDKNGKFDKGIIPEVLSEALAVSFDTNIGHDFLEDFDKRYEFYHRKEERIPFDIEYFNKITKGGLPRKTLNIILAACVHPNTKVKIRRKIKNYKMKQDDVWEELEVSVGDIKDLLDDYEIQVTSPDGWVDVVDFVDKGGHNKYTVVIGDRMLECSGGHLLDSTLGWMSADMLLKLKDRYDFLPHILVDGTYQRITHIARNEEQIPIVDIVVSSKNKRYYANGISSHNTGIGKSLIMCHMAAANLALGKNVLYITMEMSEEKIAERIDANLTNTSLDELGDLPKDVYEKRVQKVKDKTTGRLIIKEYPTSCAGSANFRHLLNELKLKKGFVPDIIYIDYLNICASSRIKNNGNVNSYTYIKTIAEELRGLSVEANVPIVSATQTNRSGYNNSDIDLSNTSESTGLPATSDLMFGVVQTDELRELGQYLVIQLKNRYSDIDKMKRFILGVDKSRMKLYSVEESAQKDVMQDTPIFDNTRSGQDKPKLDRKNFDGFK